MRIDIEVLLRQLIGGDDTAPAAILDLAQTSDSPWLLVAAALVAPEPQTYLTRAAHSAPATRDRQLVALATAIADVFNWPVWAGFLIVAVLLCLTGLFTLSSGRKQLAQVHAVPEETVSTLKENSEWIAKRLSSERR